MILIIATISNGYNHFLYKDVFYFLILYFPILFKCASYFKELNFISATIMNTLITKIFTIQNYVSSSSLNYTSLGIVVNFLLFKTRVRYSVGLLE